MADLAEISLCEAAGGVCSAVELVEACLARVGRREGELRAFVTVCAEAALRAAAERDRERAAGRRRGPLHGVPIAVKDSIDTAGLPTTGGSRQFARRVPSRSAAAVERIEAAGAIVIGKTNLHELGLGAICAPTRNARDPSRLPGSSSGGSAVAVAAGMAPAALGTDTGGSIRIPASFNGIVGLKPTHGVVPTEGAMALCPGLDHLGPMARTVADAELLFRVLSGQRRSVSSVPPLRVGVPAQADAAPTSDDVRAAFAAATAVLADRGHRLIGVDLPELELAPAAEMALVLKGASERYGRELAASPERFGADVRALLERGRDLPAAEHEAAVRSRSRLGAAVRRAFAAGNLDLLATPTVEGTAPGIGTDTESLVAQVPARACVAFSLTGQPAITIPCGADREGMPIGLSLAGRPDQDALLLALAGSIEPCLPGRAGP